MSAVMWRILSMHTVELLSSSSLNVVVMKMVLMRVMITVLMVVIIILMVLMMVTSLMKIPSSSSRTSFLFHSVATTFTAVLLEQQPITFDTKLLVTRFSHQLKEKSSKNG